MKRVIYKLVATTIVLLMSFQLFAGDMVVIGSKDSAAKLDKQAIKNIFIGKDLTFLPIDQNRRKIRNAFYKNVVEKKYGAVKGIWGRLVFTGKASKPNVVGNDKAVIQAVMDDTTTVGYINKSSLTGEVKVLIEF